MPRHRQQSATSAQALAASTAPAAVRPRALEIADELGHAGSKDALARLNAAMADIKALSVAPLIQRAVDAIRDDDAKAATEWSLRALEKDDQNGFIAGTEDEWIDKLSRLLRSAELRRRLGQAGRATVEEKYSAITQSPRVYEIFKSVLRDVTSQEVRGFSRSGATAQR